MEMEYNVMVFSGAQSHGIGIGRITLISREKMFHPEREGSATHRLECEDVIEIAPHSSYVRSATHR
jgi:hypothetical protein